MADQRQQQTGTRDQTYDVVAVVYHALQGAENCRTYSGDARDQSARQFFEEAAQAQRTLAERGKQMLQQCLLLEAGSAGRADQAGSAQESGVTFEPDQMLQREVDRAGS